MELNPIGTFHCSQTYAYDAARQGTLAEDNLGTVELNAGQNFEQALQDLAGFSHIWIVFHFHQNEHWRPLVKPPRGKGKVGVFASRAPYRPNGIGLSAVKLLQVKGRQLTVSGHDILDGTPILDIKPYIPYADAIPDATGGWTDALADDAWTITISEDVQTRLVWLASQGVDCLEAFLRQQLGNEPFDGKRKRVRLIKNDSWEIAYRTWRAEFTRDREGQTLEVIAIRSGYSLNELTSEDDPYDDKAVHRAYAAQFD